MPIHLDPLTGRSVLFAPGRELRPNDFSSGEKHACPFCAGAESQTPTEVDRINSPDGGWLTRVVPNRYPIVTAEDGTHEVVIESPRHVRRFVDLSPAEAQAAVAAWQRRVDAHTAAGYPYVLHFKNEGQAAGASLEHLHSQILALPSVPEQVQQLRQRLASQGMYDAYLPVQTIHQVQVVVPTLPRSPGELWLLPTADVTLGDARFAAALQAALKAIDQAAFNLVLQYHPGNWWIEIIPRSSSIAGFELATGCWINPVAPEHVVEMIKKALDAVETHCPPD